MLQVLIVDDDPGQLRVREAILRGAGLVVHIATNADSALALLRSIGEKVGVVVTDHFLPGRTGADMVRELRLTAPSLPVVVLSGMPDIEDAYSGLDVSIRSKPCPPQDLIRVIRDLLSAK
jgi:DNA-binding NtrC family response regulator